MPGRGGQRYDRSDSEPPVQGFHCFGWRQLRNERLLGKLTDDSGALGALEAGTQAIGYIVARTDGADSVLSSAFGASSEIRAAPTISATRSTRGSSERLSTADTARARRDSASRPA